MSFSMSLATVQEFVAIGFYEAGMGSKADGEVAFDAWLADHDSDVFSDGRRDGYEDGYIDGVDAAESW